MQNKPVGTTDTLPDNNGCLKARSNIAVFNEHLWHKCALSMPVYACRCGIVVVLCTCLQNYTDRLVNIHGVAK